MWRAFIEQQDDATAANGSHSRTFYLFKHESPRHQFLARFRRREILPRRRLAELRLAELRLEETRLEETRQALEPLMEVIAALGRLPDPAEFAGAQAVSERFGSLKRAFAAIRRITGAETWEAIARRRREDLLVYLALARFRQRPKISHLPLTLQRDMKAFFGAYRRACAEADACFRPATRPPSIWPANAGRGPQDEPRFPAECCNGNHILFLWTSASP